MNRSLNLALFFLVASIVCFAIGLLVAVGVIQSNEDAWLSGGALAFVLSAVT